MVIPITRIRHRMHSFQNLWFKFLLLSCYSEANKLWGPSFMSIQENILMDFQFPWKQRKIGNEKYSFRKSSTTEGSPVSPLLLGIILSEKSSQYYLTEMAKYLVFNRSVEFSIGLVFNVRGLVIGLPHIFPHKYGNNDAFFPKEYFRA